MQARERFHAAITEWCHLLQPEPLTCEVEMLTFLEVRGDVVDSRGLERVKGSRARVCFFMLFVDTKSHLTTKPSNFDIKCQSNSKSYDQHVFFGPSLSVVRIFYLRWDVFTTRESALGLTGWTFSYRFRSYHCKLGTRKPICLVTRSL